jgi:formiminotetrahydrofolate cyclodeaminase
VTENTNENINNTTRIWQCPAEEFLTQAASAAPAPGGGSIAAYSAAMAAAMLCMVANLTVGKEKYRDVATQAATVLWEAQNLLAALQKQVSRDIEAFGRFAVVWQMPKETEADQAARAVQLQETLRNATEAPLATARYSLNVLEWARILAPIGNASAISDVGVAAYLAEGALQAALLSVDINLKSLRDPAYVAKVQAERTLLPEQAADLRQQVIAMMERRL